MLILVLLCENERQRWDASRYKKARSANQISVFFFHNATESVIIERLHLELE